MNTDYLSEEKFSELSAEIEFLKTEGRAEVAKRLEYAKSLGDLKENAEYHEAKEAFSNLEERIADVESTLKNVTIVKRHHSVRVELGSRVRTSRKGTSEPKWYTVVGSRDADALQGKISNESPMGAAMLGKKKGDKFVVKTPKGEMEYKIEELE
ncbi:MAG: transcription elongation factor GreA [Candidatus Vogelbacteria bacterium CG10_big_fil_rev_8_21_14_0_10_51_16]|uniref:Transcription elongation factor GreA n=1 Tax=Candidatus Vogelbacteria bacterium CG10_big_fil_rev_8_21_14_0_10_51_16 TaxID=1975045 RepID=A0A2H0RE68_9BACT|nr:MAG: transcription elongation factor GreA [Candidatus Vogelbacteria bacterium CG10_big_fil_rev_8_21_14_0_10_51_16]